MASDKMLGSFDQKSAPEDNDLLVEYDAAASKVKNVKFGGVWNWIVKKLTSAVINELQTSSKNVVGAINELNSKTCSFYSYGIRNIGANSNAKISISSPDIKEQCFLVMLAGAHETQCFFFIYGINSSNNTVNHTNFLDTNVVLTGSLDDKTIYIQIGPWARGFICSYNSFTVAIK